MNKPYKLFIDDERFPVTDDWVIVRTSKEAIDYVAQNGFPREISFDHDLGYDDTSIRFLHWIAEALMDGKLTIPENFTYSVHSQNPVGAKNIHSYMQCILKAFKK